IQKMLQPNGPGTSTRAAPSTNAPMVSTTTNTAMAEEVVYICPMPEHVALQYEHPGKCPLCGMTLVPVTQETLAKIQPGGHLEYYTCHMAEHSDVHAAKAGKCPRCGMTLIPVMVQPKTEGSMSSEKFPE